MLTLDTRPRVPDDGRTMDRLSTLTTEQYRQMESVETMRVLMAKACARDGGLPEEHYEARWGRGPTAPIVLKAFEWERRQQTELLTKAAVAPGTTTDATWAQPLATSRVIAGFLALVRQTSVIGKLPVMTIPFGTTLPFQVSGASMKWVGQNDNKPVTKLGFGNLTLAPTKAAGIVVSTAELAKFSVPGSEDALKQILQNELVTFTDAAFLSAAAATVANPAGILNGVTVSASIAATSAALFTARPNAIAPTWIVSPANIEALWAIDPLNVPTRFKGRPLVVSPGAGANLILIDAAAIAVADGGLTLDVSDQALVQMDDAPVTPTAATLYTSLWQENKVGILVERFLNWKAATGAVQFTATLT